jgi:Delta24-sterol reductase
MDNIPDHSQSVAEAQKILKRWSPSSPYARHPKEKRQSNMAQKKAYKNKTPSLGLERLNRPLYLDTVNKTILVEPGITMEELTRASLPYGLIPPVVPEFKGITVGGAINGAGLESSSHRFGQFSDSVLSCEVMLGDGSIIKASPRNNSELFYGISGSYGTLGFLLSAEIKLVRAEEWICLNCRRFPSIDEALNFMRSETADMIEAIVYSNENTAVITGSFILPGEAEKMKQIRHTSYWHEWFYSRFERMEDETKAMPLKDYLFRHDRGAFWMGGYVAKPSFPKNYLLNRSMKHCRPGHPGLLFRLLFGHMFSSQKLYAKLKANHEWIHEQFVIQDFYLPEDNAGDFVRHVLKRHEIMPIWLCPVKATTTPQIFSPHQSDKDELLFDVGVYGLPSKLSGFDAARDLEALCQILDGKKMLYGLNGYSEEEFWNLYPQKAYRKLREKSLLGGVIPDITEKLLMSFESSLKVR